MMYHPEMRSAIPSGIRAYDPREQALAVKYGGPISPSVEISMRVDRKYFIFGIGEVPGAVLNQPTLDLIILSGGGRDLILEAIDCNVERIDSLKEGDIIKAYLIDPEKQLAIGGGWAISEVLNGSLPLYLSPGSRRFTDLF